MQSWLRTAGLDNVLFVAALLALAIGCAIERPALGLIVPAGIVLALIVAAWVLRSVLAVQSNRPGSADDGPGTGEGQ